MKKSLWILVVVIAIFCCVSCSEEVEEVPERHIVLEIGSSINNNDVQNEFNEKIVNRVQEQMQEIAASVWESSVEIQWRVFNKRMKEYFVSEFGEESKFLMEKNDLQVTKITFLHEEFETVTIQLFDSPSVMKYADSESLVSHILFLPD